MRYLRHAVRSPRLLLQLTLVLILACLIGGTGLVALRVSHGAVSSISEQRMPALVDVLQAERDVTQANFDALTVFVSPDTGTQPDFAWSKVMQLRKSAVQSFHAYLASAGRARGHERLEARIDELLRTWLSLGSAALSSGRPSASSKQFVYALGAANAQTVGPLRQSLAELATLQEADLTSAGDSAESLTGTVAALLIGVMLIALLAIGFVQVGMSAREQRRRALFQASGDLVGFLDAHGVIQYTSASYERILGYRPADLKGTRAFDLLHPDDRVVAAAALARTSDPEAEHHEQELRMRHADGSYHWMAFTASDHLNDPLLGCFVVTGRDVTAHKDTQEAMAHQSFYDPLTGLPNRLLLLTHLEEALIEAARLGQPMALLLLDLDRFKEVNDTLGHQAGDTLLKLVSTRLAAAVRTDDMVARLGGDEFAVLLCRADEQIALQLAHRLSEALEDPFVVAEEGLEIGVSIGIGLYPEHGRDPQVLLRHAEVAMYQAKHDHVPLRLYDATHDEHSIHRLALMRELRLALQDGQLMVYYQPKVMLRTNEMCGVEALLRWRHPTHGFVLPDQFIPLAEQTGLIGPLTEWVLDTALSQCRIWHDAGQPIPVAVNLSARMLQEAQLADRVALLLARHGIAPGHLTLEITETSLMADPAGAKAVLTNLHCLGVQLSIDDFGTGYSSLGYLKELPVQELKVDKSFVLGMDATAETKDAAIVRSVIAMAHALDLKVVAEGVENAEAWAMLDDLSCDAIQGYYICRPVPPADLQANLLATPMEIRPWVLSGAVSLGTILASPGSIAG